MDIEDLSKGQLLLLGVLVSFVTSIGTGILTVTMLDAAPISVTQSITSVVERTVETVVPSATSTPTRETTIVVKDEQALADAVAKHASRVVAIHSGTGTTTKAVGVGLYIPGLGVASSGLAVTEGLSARFVTGERVSLLYLRTSDAGVMAFTAAEGSAFPSLQTASFAAASSLRLGATVAAIGEDGALRLGIVSLVGKEGAVRTTVPGEGLTPGVSLVNTYGEIVGIKTDDPGLSAASVWGADALRSAFSDS